MNSIKRYIAAGILTAVGFVPVAFADDVLTKPIPCIPNIPCISETTQKSGDAVRGYVLGTFGSSFLQGFLGICAVTAVIFIIIGGIQMHVALGNEEAVGKAKKTVIWAVAGLVLAVLSVAIVSIISNIQF